MTLPKEYIDKMKALLKDDYSLYEESLNMPSFHGLRINTLKISCEEFEKLFPYKLERIPWTSDGYYYFDEEVNKHPFFYAGLYYLQEPSAMLPAEILPINENEYVLDACAAPGGKSTKLLCKLKGSGCLVSNDISVSRQNATQRNIERFGGSNCFVISEDINKLASKYKNTFDKILVDAPCSGEGMFRKDSSLIKSWLEKGPEYYSSIQKDIIKSCMEMLKEGGMLLYSTCTFDEREDEEIIKYALSISNTKIIPIKQYNGFSSNQYGTKLFPHKVKGEGHFVSLIQKEGTLKTNINAIEENPIPEYLNEYMNAIDDGQIENINNKLYLHPVFNNNSIRTLKSGLYLGEYTNKHFEPSQALAMSIKSKDYQKVIDFEANDPRVIKYLKGETISVDEKEDGYYLVCVNSFPLGFAKITNKLFKNKIDKGWIYR